MESILENEIRNGNFSSSQAYRLASEGKAKGSVGAPFYKYVSEKRRELKLRRSIKIEKSSRSTIWGNFLEQRVHDLLPLGYELQSKKTLPHPTILGWVGSPDSIKRDELVVSDIKCLEPDAFTEYVDMLEEAKGNTEHFKKNDPEKYWQLVSNACILEYNFIEAIPYMPYESELPEIREMAETYDGYDQYKYRFIYEVDKSELPYLPNDSGYKNLYVFRFEVPQSDKDFLTERVKMAIEERDKFFKEEEIIILDSDDNYPQKYAEKISKGNELRKKTSKSNVEILLELKMNSFDYDGL